MLRYLTILVLLAGCDVSAPVTVDPNIPPGVVDVKPGAVTVQPGAVEVAAQLKELRAALAETQQKLDAAITTGRDSYLIPVNLSGSGWPLALALSLACGAAFYAWKLRGGKRALEDSAVDVAAVIDRLPQGARSQVLDGLDGRMRNEQGWKALLRSRGRGSRRTA